MKSIAVFASEAFDHDAGWDEESATQKMPSGRDRAVHLIADLQKRDVKVENSEPYQEEVGWIVGVEIGDQRFEVFASWCAPNSGDGPFLWAVTLSARKTFFFRASSLGQNHRTKKLTAFCQSLTRFFILTSGMG